MRRVPVLVLTGLLVPGLARADGDTDKQIAQALFDEGRALMERGAFHEACPKLAESERLDPAGGTLLNLAVCHEAEGKTATAWQELHDARSQAIRDDRKDRVDLADAHLAALEPSLVRIVVRVAFGGPPAARLTLDGSEVARVAWGSGIPVDPGVHHIAMTVDGDVVWETTLSAAAPGKTYDVEAPAVALVARTPETPAAARVATMPAPVPPSQATPTRRSLAFWVVGGGGVASLVASAVTGIVALDANAYVNDNCSAARQFCRVADAGEAATRAKTYAWVSTGALVLGVGAIAVALLLPRAPGGTVRSAR